MNEVERWLRRQAAREQRGVLLEEGLLGGRLWSYTHYRLRYFFLKYLVETAVHTVTVLFLVLELAWQNFLPIVLAHAAASFAGNFWWGALEGLRTQVRDLHRSGKPHRIASVIGGWLVFSALLSVGVIVLTIGWVAWHTVAGPFGAGEAYVTVLLLRLAVDLPTRCYHSGVYALRRVYKPAPAILGAELLELAIILALAPLVGLWALVVASVVLTVALTSVTLRYTGKVYRFIGFAPLRDVNVRRFAGALRGAGRESLLAGGANAAIALDSLVVLALLYGAAADSNAVVVLFLVGPSIRAAADWARLFYFDLKRLELRLFTNMRRRFERHTAQLAWVLGLALWAVAAAVTRVFYPDATGTPYAPLLAFFLARSLLARVQVQAFAEGAYAPVLVTGVAMVAALGGASLVVDSEGGLITAVAVATAAAAAVLTQLRRLARERGDPGAALLTLEWLRRLGGVTAPVVVGSARVLSASGPDRLDARTREDQLRWRLAQVAERAAQRLGTCGASAWVGPDRLIWFQDADEPRLVTGRWLQQVTGGLVSDVLERTCAGGEDALLAAAQHRLLGAASGHLLSAVVPVDLANARREFADLVPAGVVYAPDEAVPEELARLPGRELRAILGDAVAYAHDLRVARQRSRYDVTALCAGGELRLIFMANLHVDRAARNRWRKQVTRHNIRAAIGGARRAPAVRRSAARLTALANVPGLSSRAASQRVRSRVEAADALARVPLLSELARRDLERIAAAMTERTFAPGEDITREKEAGVGFFVITGGQAAVSVGGRKVTELGPGDHFGELALIAESTRLATVTSLTELSCCRLASWEFRRLIEGSATISWKVLQSTARLLIEARRGETPLTDSTTDAVTASSMAILARVND